MGIETYLTQAGVSGKDRFWIKACILAAYTKLANQEMRGLIDEDLLATTDTMNVATNTGRKHVFEELQNACENGNLDPVELTKRFAAARRAFHEPQGGHHTNHQGVINYN